MIADKHSYAIDLSIPDSVIMGSYSAIGKNFTVVNKTDHPSIGDKKFVSNYPFNERMSISDYPKCSNNQAIIIGNDVWIGDNVTVLGGIVIGSGSIIGANSVVAKSIPQYAIVVGNPAKVKRMRFDDTVIDKLMKIAWWNWDDETVLSRLEYMKDVNRFIEKYYKEIYA